MASCTRVQRPRLAPSLRHRSVHLLTCKRRITHLSPSPPRLLSFAQPSSPSFSHAAPLGRPLCLRAQRSICPHPPCIVVHPPRPAPAALPTLLLPLRSPLSPWLLCTAPSQNRALKKREPQLEREAKCAWKARSLEKALQELGRRRLAFQHRASELYKWKKACSQKRRARKTTTRETMQDTVAADIRSNQATLWMCASASA